MSINRVKDRAVEFIKYDFNQYKLPLVWASVLVISALKILNKHSQAFSLASQVFRTGWKGSDKVGLREARYYFVENPLLGKQIVGDSLNTLEPIGNTAKFVENPLLMLDGVITVIKNPEGDEKGVFVIKYSYYFSLFLKCFDAKAIGEKFHIILEPSWAGLCELNILAYTQFEFPVFLQVYEERDRELMDSLNSNIKSVEVGPSWFINHKDFEQKVDDTERDIDIIMVAAWAKFKRHRAFFRAIAGLKAQMPQLKIALVGYPVDMTKEEVLEIAMEFNLDTNIEIHEWISPKEVAALQCRAKVNVLWSKFEGNNRAIIEGMLCGSPALLRDGHNYGYHYDYINDNTGSFASESDLGARVKAIISNEKSYNPRSYILRNRNCVVATQILADTIASYEKNYKNGRTKGLAVKVNELHGMTYLDGPTTEFNDSYDWLAKHLL